jgi:Fe-S cluster assembly protein SufB
VITIEIVGLSEENIKKISDYKKEEDYFLKYRLDSLHKFYETKDPTWGPSYNIDYDKIIYYKI